MPTRAALALLLFPLAGCGPLGALGSVLGGDTAAADFDAHVVYQQRAGCPTLVARTLEHGYTLLTLREPVLALAPTGVFEGPIREGESIFRYTPPDTAPVWDGQAVEVAVDVHAVRLTLPAARAQFVARCGLPDGEGGPADDAVPRLPAGR